MPKLRCFLLVVLRLTCRMLLLVIPRVWALMCPSCLKVPLLFFLVVLRLTSRMLRMVIRRVWALFSPSCLKVRLLFAGSLKVGF